MVLRVYLPLFFVSIFSTSFAFSQQASENKISDIVPKKKSHWHLASGYIGWQELVDLNGPTGKTGLSVLTGGVTLDFGYTSAANRFGWNWGGSLFGLYAQGDVGSTQRKIQYFQRGVPVVGVGASLETLWVSKSSPVSIGFGAMLLQRSTDFTVPNSSYSFESGFLQRLFYGGYLKTNWDFGNWSFYQQFGRLNGMTSSIWLLGFGYKL